MVIVVLGLETVYEREMRRLQLELDFCDAVMQCPLSDAPNNPANSKPKRAAHSVNSKHTQSSPKKRGPRHEGG